MAQNSETKKRLLLSKWRTYQEAGEYGRECDCHVGDLEAALTDVRYWLLSGLVHHQLVSDPRQMLRKVEDALS